MRSAREAFERAFLERESHVHKAEGFAGFELLRRDREGEYVVLSRWESDEAFKAWVNSDLFKTQPPSRRRRACARQRGPQLRR